LFEISMTSHQVNHSVAGLRGHGLDDFCIIGWQRFCPTDPRCANTALVDQGIDLSDLGAGKFDFIGTVGFSGTGAEVNAITNGGQTTIRIDMDGDGTADMKIILTGVMGVQDGDFIL